MFLEVSATLPVMELSARERAAVEYRRAAEELGMTAVDIARAGGIPDADTVRDFMEGARWPRTPTRNRLEKAVGWPTGSIDAIMRGERVETTDTGEDRVVAAIEASQLTRANKHRLIGAYYDLIDQQQGEGVRGA